SLPGSRVPAAATRSASGTAGATATARNRHSSSLPGSKASSLSSFRSALQGFRFRVSRTEMLQLAFLPHVTLKPSYLLDKQGLLSNHLSYSGKNCRQT